MQQSLKHEDWKWATSKCTLVTAKVCMKLATPPARKCPKTQFWGHLGNWKFEPPPRPHPHFNPNINTHNRSKHYVRIYHGIHWDKDTGLKSLPHWKTRVWLPVVSNTVPYTSTKICWSWAQFQKGQPTLSKSTYAFPAHASGLESFGHIILPATGPGLRHTVHFLSSTKMGWA